MTSKSEVRTWHRGVRSFDKQIRESHFPSPLVTHLVGLAGPLMADQLRSHSLVQRRISGFPSTQLLSTDSPGKLEFVLDKIFNKDFSIKISLDPLFSSTYKKVFCDSGGAFFSRKRNESQKSGFVKNLENHQRNGEKK